jgi:sRNA-binding protein
VNTIASTPTPTETIATQTATTATQATPHTADAATESATDIATETTTETTTVTETATDTSTETAAPTTTTTTQNKRKQRFPDINEVYPVLEILAQHYPALFGAQFLPLKRGIFQDLLQAHPEQLQAESLKAALGYHTRSGRYLNCVATGLPRHDLSGAPVEDLTPEQIHHALLEVFRRRAKRSTEDLRPQLCQRIQQAFEASGLSREDYAQRTQGRDEEANQLTAQALDAAASQAARDEALLRSYEASGQTVESFANMYAIPTEQAQKSLERAQNARAGGKK